jgi:hypothetical protein
VTTGPPDQRNAGHCWLVRDLCATRRCLVDSYRVGINPALDDTRLIEWPRAYRLGLARGLVIMVLAISS